MPEWKYVQGAWSTKVFNIQSATTTRRHQFAFQDGMTTIFFPFRWYQLGHFVVHQYVSVFGMLAHWKPKYRGYVILCCLVILIFYLWLNRGLLRTIVLPLPTSRIHSKITLFITCQDPLAEEVDLLLSHAKGFMFCEIKAVFFLPSNILIKSHLWWQGFSPCDSISTSTVQEKWLYSKKVFFFQNSLRYQRSWLLHPINSFFVVISTFTSMTT